MPSASAAAPDHAPHARTGLLLATLSAAGACYSLLQSLVAPALPTIQHDLGVSTTAVAWIFTAYLLSASIVTPIAGRLGDMFGKKKVFIVAVAALGVGSLIAALSSSLGPMIAGRAIQGIGGAVFPLSYAIIRDEFPRHKVAGGIAITSVVGLGAGAWQFSTDGGATWPAIDLSGGSLVLLADGGEADAAIAEHDRRRAMPGRGRQHGVPGGLAVVMGVDVNKARRDPGTAGVHGFARSLRDAADLDDAAILHAQVGTVGRRAGAVHQRAAPDQQIKHGVPLGCAGGRCDAKAGPAPCR